MLPSILLLLLFAAPQASNDAATKTSVSDDGPQYIATGEMVRPESYREWVFLTSGVDMSYSDSATATRSVFDNVFVNPSAYRSFLKTGTWPDKTVLVLEIRGAEGAASINKRGHTQSHEVRGIEVHVKDSSKEGSWTFYGFGSDGPGKPFPRTASCYSCHEQHGVVDTTFTQFYPTLLPLAKKHSTIRPDLMKELEPVPTAEATPAATSAPASSK